jgi:hypothetical protein
MDLFIGQQLGILFIPGGNKRIPIEADCLQLSNSLWG